MTSSTLETGQAQRLRVTVNSFDLFDTLLVRRAIIPSRVFEDVERKTGAKGFTSARQTAEQGLIQRGEAYDLAMIYREMIRLGQCAEDVAALLMKAEIEAEFDHAVPIAENLAKVQEHDLIVSDMYLPTDVLRRLLRHIGLKHHVYVFVSNAGKHTGSIWPHLSEYWLIRQHLGDNAHSDVASPGAYGIPAVHYPNSQPSQIEQLLARHGQIELAGVVRALRLSCPLANDSNEGRLWQLVVQLNAPLLCLAAAALNHHVTAHQHDRILFSARDCYQLADIFGLLFPLISAEYVHVSRRSLCTNLAGIDALLTRAGSSALVVDIAATGNSWYGLAETLKRRVNLFALVRVDHHAYPNIVSQQQLADSTYLSFASLARNSQFPGYSNAIEVLNTAPHGTSGQLGAFGALLVPEFEPGHELPPEVVSVVDQAHRAALDMIRKSCNRLREELPAEPNRELLLSLLQTISVNPLLQEIGRVLV
jgi:hypothetical protein